MSTFLRTLRRRIVDRAAKVALLLLVAVISMAGLAPAASAVNPKTFAIGSLIIPMDTTSQNLGMFKAYGLVYKLLQSGVPVYWLIADGKAFNGIDFSVNAKNHYTGVVVGTPYVYTGGPFVIDQSNVAVADPIITAWRNANGANPALAIHETTASLTFPDVQMVLQSPPRIALEQTNASIAIAYFNAAGIPDGNGSAWTALSPNVLSEARLAGCPTGTCTSAAVGDGALFSGGACSTRKYDVFVTPHNGGYAYSLSNTLDLGTQTYAELDYFVGQGGGWIATCHSILSNENAIVALYNTTTPAVRALFKSPTAGGFLTQSGFTTISNVSGTWTVDPGAADLPIAQAVSTIVANGLPGGSVQDWPSPFGPGSHTGAPAYWPQAERVASFITGTGIQYDTAVNGAYHNGEGQGKMTFLGGHSYSTALPYSINYEAPYLRFFYNSLFFNSAAVANMALLPSATSVPQGNNTALQIALKNTGGSVAVGVGALTPVTVTLLSGVAFVSMASGPTPTVVVNGDGTTTLTFAAGSIGDVAGGTNAFVINTSVYFAATGPQQIATLSGRYGDQLQEAFTNNSCASVLVVQAPGTAITITPASAVANVGDVFTWTLSYSNPGASSLRNAYVEDLLPTANFAFTSATPAPTSVVPVGSNTRVRWTIGTIPAGGSGTITIRAVVQTGGGPFTSTATLRGNDAAGNVYSASGRSDITVNPPLASIVKTVSPTGPQNPNTTLTYSLSPYSLGCATAPCPATSSPTLFSNLRIFDAPPLNTNSIGGISHGGTNAAYVPIAAVLGVDSGSDPQTTTTLTYSAASPFTQVLGSTITVTMALFNQNASTASITVDTASLTPSDAVSTCTLSTALPVTVNRNATVNLSFTCTIASYAEITWDGDASGTFNGVGTPAYDFPTATSASVLGVPTSTGTNIVQWLPATDSNTAPVPMSVSVLGTGPALFALEGGTAVVERYDISANTWAKLPAPLPAANGYGGALVYDGGGYANGFVYSLRGVGTNAFYRYKLSNGTTGAWTAMATTPWNVGAGGALATLGGLIYALEGGSTSGFAVYNPVGNSWTTLANVPATVQTVQKGGALATDGTFIYASIGNNKKNFYRYNAATNSWSAMASSAQGFGDGAALTAIGAMLYQMQGNNNKNFYRYAPNAGLGTWTKLATLPANTKSGGALTTDGTTIWALRGNNQKSLFAYNVAVNTWSTKANTITNVNAGGALAWTPESQGATLSTNAAASPVLVTGTLANPTTVQVVMTITSATAVTGITPNLSVVSSQANPPTGAAPAGCTVSPAGTRSISAGGSLTFTWTCTNAYATNTNQGNSLGSLTFSAGAVGTGPATTWTAAQANSILITQPLTFTAKIDNPTAATQIQNQALLSDDAAYAQGVPSNVVTTPVIQPAVVAAVKSVTPTGEVTPGTQLTYTIDVQNTTAGTATVVVFTDAIPANSTYVGGSCLVTGGSVNTCNGAGTFNVGTLGPYGAATLTFKVTANTPAAAGNTTTISNSATFNYTNSSGAQPPGTTNTVTNTILATPAVTSAKAESVVPAADGNGFITPGSTITYTLTVSNPAGAVPATGVVATDLVPAGTTYVNASCIGGTSCSSSGLAAGSTVTFNIGSMAAGATSTLTFKVLVDNPSEDGDTITNSAAVTANTNIVGSTYTAYSNTVQYPIVAAPVIAVSKSASPASGSDVKVGDIIIYTLTISNSGTANTESAYVQDVIPQGTSYIANTTCLNGTLTPTPPTPPGTPWTCVGANGVMVPELTPGVPPTAGAMAVYSPGQGDADGGTLVVGSPASVSFAVTVGGTPDPSNPSGVMVNAAIAGTATVAPVTSNTTTHTKRTNLDITKTGPSSANSADAVSYTLVASNTGPSSSDGAVVSDPVVANFSTDPTTGATVSCTTLTGGAVCPAGLTLAQLQAGVAIPTFPANSSLQIVVNGFADTNTTTTTITNVATLVAPTGIADGNSGSNPTHTATQVTTIASNPTLAVIAAVRGYVEGGSSWFEWETASEIRTAAFNVLRLDTKRGGRVRLNARLLPSMIAAARGGVYRFADSTAVAGGTYTYGLEEIEITGKIRRHGPFTVTYGVGAGKRTALSQNARSGAASGEAAAQQPGFQKAARALTGRAAMAVPLAAKPSPGAGDAADNTSISILIAQDGLYTVTAAQIASALGKTSAQVQNWINKGQLRLRQKGRSVAWKADPTGNSLYFYGQALQGTDAVYTPYNVYWLDQTAGVTMTVVNGKAPSPAAGAPSFVSTLHAEQNLLPYPSLVSDPDADFWYWDTAYAQNPGLGPMATFSVPAPGATGAGTATIHALLQGASDLVIGNDHHTHLYVNGTEVNVGGGRWDGLGAITLTGTFSAGVLKTDGSANVVQVAEELDAGVPYSVVEVNSFNLEYPRYYQASGNQLRLRGAGNPAVTVSGFSGSNVTVLDISDPLNPRFLAATKVAPGATGNAVSFAPATGTTDYLAAIAQAPAAVTGNPSTTLKSANNAANYLVLTPSSLSAGANALATYRSGKVVQLRDIYNEFNFGIANPHAIQAFLAYAAQNWKTKPRFVALVGKGTIDPKDYLGLHTNLFPVLMTQTPDGVYAADNRYVDFNNDGVPNVAIGRIPALTNTDVTNYIAKVQTYESSARRPANNALVIADNPDDAGDFTDDAQAVALALQSKGYATTPVYLQNTTVADARAQIIAALNSAAGMGLVNYVGHGGTNQLADENLLSNDQGDPTFNALTNASRQPIFIAFTCAVGDGTYPGGDSLSESLLWRQGGGAVAAFAPTALSDNNEAHILNLSLVSALGGPTARPTLGEAAAAAIADFANRGGPRYMRDAYSVIGDPGLRIQQ